MITRCTWAGSAVGGTSKANELYLKYHDEEWGKPVHDDKIWFEFLVLESAQAGLSWLTILKRRNGYRDCFAQFDPHQLLQFTEVDVNRLMQDSRIIRNRAKITATINNAKRFVEVQQEYGSFDTYMWQWVNGKPMINHWKKNEEVPAVTPLAEKISKDMKQRGFRFLGPTIIYAHMQATGLVNDHLVSCFKHPDNFLVF